MGRDPLVGKHCSRRNVLYFGIYNFFGFQWVFVFLGCFGCFPVILSFSVQYTSPSGFTTVSQLFFSVWVSGLSTVKTGPPSAKFSPLAQTSSNATDHGCKNLAQTSKTLKQNAPKWLQMLGSRFACLLLLFQTAKNRTQRNHRAKGCEV